MKISKIRSSLLMSLILILTSTIGNASEIFSCKQVAEAFIGSDKAFGSALYSDDAYDRSTMSRRKPAILKIDSKKLTLGILDFSKLGFSGGQIYYADSYNGLVEVYDKRENEVTLWVLRSNGNNSQMSNDLEVNLWHCNK